MIEEEMNDSEKYAKCALKYKEERPSLAQTFHALSLDEMKHKDMLHEEVVKIINEYRATGAEVPSDMMAVYDYLHKKHIDRATEIKIIIESYKG